MHSITKTKTFRNDLICYSDYVARLSELVSYPPICIAGTDEGEIFIIDWRNYSDMERGAGRLTMDICHNPSRVGN